MDGEFSDSHRAFLFFEEKTQICGSPPASPKFICFYAFLQPLLFDHSFGGAAASMPRKAGFSILNCNPDSIGRDKIDDELAVQAKWLQVLGAEFSKAGIRPASLRRLAAC
jgi:hypothetical protein